MPRPRTPLLLRPSRRTILLACILLLAGAIVNVAVAWGIAAIADPHEEPLYDGVAPELPGAVLVLPSATTTRWRPTQALPGGLWSVTRRDFYAPISPASENAWIMNSKACRVGWPCLSLGVASNNLARTRSEPERFGGLGVPPAITDRGLFVATHGRVPVAPLTGFAINTLFYAAILALPLSFFPIRRRLRARRGRCPACGYDRAGLADAAPCPECSAS